MADHDGQGREALAAELEAFKWPRPPGMDDVAAMIVDSDFLKAHDAEVAAATAERIAKAIEVATVRVHAVGTPQFAQAIKDAAIARADEGKPVADPGEVKP